VSRREKPSPLTSPPYKKLGMQNLKINEQTEFSSRNVYGESLSRLARL
jgi:hypothetical protein